MLAAAPHMKWAALCVLVILGQGCANRLTWLADHFDQGDPCQTRAELGRPQGYQAPDWCSSGRGGQVIRDSQGRTRGTVR